MPSFLQGGSWWPFHESPAINALHPLKCLAYQIACLFPTELLRRLFERCNLVLGFGAAGQKILPASYTLFKVVVTGVCTEMS